MMAVPVLEKCCGFSLKTGTIIIGVAQSIFAFMSMALTAAYVAHPRELEELSDPNLLPREQVLHIVLVILTIISGLQCIFSVMLIFGAETNRPILLLPWLCLNPITLACYVAASLVGIFHEVDEESKASGLIAAHAVISTILAALVCYLILVVYSLFKHLKKLNF